MMTWTSKGGSKSFPALKYKQWPFSLFPWSLIFPCYTSSHVTNCNPWLTSQLKENLVNRVSNSLACYRQHCAAPSQPGQLILPETLKLLPLYCHCLLRSPALMPSLEVNKGRISRLSDIRNCCVSPQLIYWNQPRLRCKHWELRLCFYTTMHHINDTYILV